MLDKHIHYVSWTYTTREPGQTTSYLYSLMPDFESALRNMPGHALPDFESMIVLNSAPVLRSCGWQHT